VTIDFSPEVVQFLAPFIFFQLALQTICSCLSAVALKSATAAAAEILVAGESKSGVVTLAKTLSSVDSSNFGVVRWPLAAINFIVQRRRSEDINRRLSLVGATWVATNKDRMT